MSDSSSRDQPKDPPPSTPRTGGPLPGTAHLFPDVPQELMPPSLDRGQMTAQETRNASQAIEHLQRKMLSVSQELAQGKINQSQFQAIYIRYTEQKLIIERILAQDPGSDAWQNVAVAGYTGFLRSQYAAHVVGMLVIEIQSAVTLHKLGNFDLPDALLVPILSSLVGGRTAAFEAGARSTQIEGGRWLCFVPGEYCASIVIFSHEPSPSQVATISGLHRDFERANRQHLMAGRANPAKLVFPQRALFDEG
jgi:hypothetical protein